MAKQAGALMASEIAEQPEVLARLLDREPQIVATAREIAERSPRFVLLAARGTSDHAALYAKYLIEVLLGLPTGLASPSTLTAYGARPDLGGVLVIGVSQSGGSPDLLESVSVARECGALTLSVTNNPESEMAKAANWHVDVVAGKERAVAATKTYSAELMALWLLINGWSGRDSEQARSLPGLAEGLVQRRDEVAAIATRYRFTDRLVTTGRGYSYPTAREAALKLMETAYVAAHAFSGADLLHGPLAMIDRDHPVVAVVPDGVGGEAMRPVLERLKERGADVAGFVGADSIDLTTVGYLLPDQPEELAPIIDIIPLQQLALEMSVARGYDPDQPRGLSKVTQTW
ncbi:MAG: SIS domain-containing protein [Candidatus Nanopelagicales bacterium]|nr:SIS domain-containing protein [Candidatus Nanopelagicales bacterium]MDZ4249500.1 SIS domain-containing protein [Candidatus Nanopelagicales bacterium]